jgi:phosphoribosyl-AMP cyclohydrolase
LAIRNVIQKLDELTAERDQLRVIAGMLEQAHIPSGEFWLPNRKTVWYDGEDSADCWRLTDENNVCDMDISYPTALAAIRAGMGWDEPGSA